ncbi:MAG TPA: hypothetical protein VF796_25000 [Humisphaera sp.]
MLVRPTLIALFVLSLVATRPAAAQTAEPLPTAAEIKALYDAGEYQKALPKLARVLTLKGKAAEPYNRHELLVLRGETYLRVKGSSASAAASFAEASKEAPDGQAAALDIANELLIRRSTNALVYTPKQKDPKDKAKPLAPINILEPDGRKAGIAALYNDELAVLEPKLKAADAARTLQPVLDLLPPIRQVRWLEMAATGADANAQKMVAALADRAKRQCDTALKEMTEDLEPIDKAINEPWQARIPINDKQTGKIMGFETKWKRRGPQPRQLARMQEMFATTGKIHAACDELGGTLGKTGHEFDDVKARAEILGGKLKRRLDTDWRAAFDVQPPPVQ